jgi:molybdopterin-guanine dinucleotide biosynthesis protein A
VVVLACDLIVPDEALDMLSAHIPLSDDTDGVAAVDDEGNRQPLLAVYRLDALRRLARDSAPTTGRSLRSLLAPLRVREVRMPSFLCTDIDTVADARTHHLTFPPMPDFAIGE